MKKKLFFIIQICTVIFAATGFYSCNDTVETGIEDAMKGISIIPNPMTIGQMVTISGPGFANATEIIFPGNVSVTNLTKAGNFQLSTTVPSGVATEGNITVVLPSGKFVIPQNVTIVATKDIYAKSKDQDPVTKNYRVGPNDELIIYGHGLDVIEEIEIPGSGFVKSMNFVKKSESEIKIDVPMGGFDRQALGRVKMITKSKEVVYTTNVIDWSGEGYVPPAWLLLAGKSSSKTWEWDLSKGNCWGKGDFRNENNPTWWAAPGNHQNWITGEGPGATMTFSYKGKKAKDLTLTKNRTNSTEATGFWSIDMDERFDKCTRPKGKIRTSGITLLCGRGEANVDVFEYWVLKLTDDEMLLGIPQEVPTWDYNKEGYGNGCLWVFKVKK